MVLELWEVIIYNVLKVLLNYWDVLGSSDVLRKCGFYFFIVWWGFKVVWGVRIEGVYCKVLGLVFFSN